MSLRKFPNNLPYLVVAFTAIPFFVFLVMNLYAEGQIGRPSSTAGLGYIFIPIISAIVAIVFLTIGKFVRSWIADTYPGPTIMTWRAMGIMAVAFLLVVIAAGAAGWVVIAYHEAKQRPHVIVDKGLIKKMAEAPLGMEGADEASQVAKAFSAPMKGVLFRDEGISFSLEDGSFKIQGADGSMIARVDLSGYDYIRTVQALPISLGDGGEGLALLADLRATSFRAMLLVYDQNLELIYQELLERRGSDPIMRTMADAQGAEVLYVNVKHPFYYSLKQ